ncbi:MAG: Asp-tRNA(Asn)/Glu-tRNA(Gln) amidotransferase subunit GatB [Erysipelotrichaceae bacterium]
MNFETVIGIEIHLELKTKTKMFSNSKVDFNDAPNTNVNEIDLALPGTLPTVNKEAVRMALRACKALNCTIDPLIKFDRKNYYYSDLPKGYQITQQFYPIGSNGYIMVPYQGKEVKIRINRIHMEEDTAKQLHTDNGTYIDYNRAGTPLIEVVSEADIRDGEMAASYINELKNIFYYLGISDCKMEQGSLRCDVNVSIRPYGVDYFGTKVEIKNVNSINYIQKAIESEVKRQESVILSNQKIIQSTWRYDEKNRKNILMRLKEGSVDYRFFPEPNILPIRLSEDFVGQVINNLPQLPKERLNQYLDNGLTLIESNILVNNKELGDYFNQVVEIYPNYKSVCNWVIGDFLNGLNKNNMDITKCLIQPQNLANLIKLVDDKDISGKQGKEVLTKIYDGSDALSLVEKMGIKQNSNVDYICKVIEDVLKENEQSINDYHSGKDKALGFLIGKVMKITKGQVNPALTNKLMIEALNKYQS